MTWFSPFYLIIFLILVLSSTLTSANPLEGRLEVIGDTFRVHLANGKTTLLELTSFNAPTKALLKRMNGRNGYFNIEDGELDFALFENSIQMEDEEKSSTTFFSDGVELDGPLIRSATGFNFPLFIDKIPVELQLKGLLVKTGILNKFFSERLLIDTESPSGFDLTRVVIGGFLKGGPENEIDVAWVRPAAVTGGDSFQHGQFPMIACGELCSDSDVKWGTSYFIAGLNKRKFEVHAGYRQVDHLIKKSAVLHGVLWRTRYGINVEVGSVYTPKEACAAAISSFGKQTNH